MTEEGGPYPFAAPGRQQENQVTSEPVPLAV
jgi:hypothetical protein